LGFCAEVRNRGGATPIIVPFVLGLLPGIGGFAFDESSLPKPSEAPSTGLGDEPRGSGGGGST
jgi:hypothetical protein